MSRDQRFPGYRLWRTSRAGTRRRWRRPAGVRGRELILAVFALQTDALFSLFSAGTLLPALIYAATVALYIVKRKALPPSQGFTLGKVGEPGDRAGGGVAGLRTEPLPRQLLRRSLALHPADGRHRRVSW